ncbi:hypothetical protein [Mucilaginibacter sp. KACC 22063]|uniref:hypothetical protein n=1 Tax=Mucilaginibacter sp. KACC 22063 TaxID=3025666 RepID=UPI00236687C6|nr:hypothetical protein [Mucilaginibacter sp. KACC 22063]WDF54617.1 hypothetical protein PQ461_16925 [Mucilaginibacter sp. KACC 22063]
MKNSTKTSKVSKLVARFDNELKALLMEDLRAVKTAKNQILEKIANTAAGNRLSAA